ncbi:hypothetical protein DEM27_25980 [Metarhizobium album]|uniref:Transposase n=1 Tax=Metarhizobium album TaxID=2182425 RepID=A0A2U2DJH8_9HYPH|nr:hypothetical protein DEM27_25980 [Rhizobium album]
MVRRREAFDTARGGDPDVRIADVARRHDIKPQQIYTWRRKFAAEQAEPVVSFLPVALIATPSSDEAERPAPVDKPTTKRSARPIRIKIGCKGGRVLKVEANIEPDVLKALIRSLKTHDCARRKCVRLSRLRCDGHAQGDRRPDVAGAIVAPPEARVRLGVCVSRPSW